MTFRKRSALGAFAIICLAGAAVAQTPQTPSTSPAASGGPAVASPTYTSIPLEITVSRPAVEVWKRIGKFCDIGEWLQVPCTITSGKDGEFGAVRSVAGEVLVGKTELSYTYTQTVRNGRPYNLYHGTLEARPVTRDHLEDRLHAVLRQLDAGRRRRARGGQDASDRDLHDGRCRT